MATDVQILSAARAVSFAEQEAKAADQAKVEADRLAGLANTASIDARRRWIEAERKLIELSRQKPAEPVESPKVEDIPVRPFGPVAAEYIPAGAPVQHLPDGRVGPVPTLTRKRERV